MDTVTSVSKPHIQGSRLRRPLIRDDVKTDTWDVKMAQPRVHGWGHGNLLSK